jgi:hypothetical protein
MIIKMKKEGEQAEGGRAVFLTTEVLES